MRLGTAVNQINTWHIIKTIDLENVTIEVNTIIKQWEQLRKSTLYRDRDRYQNHELVLDTIIDEILRKMDHIVLPQNTRTKRGAINFVGSIFKALTGNLDAEDGQRFEEAIKSLQDNQNNIAVISEKKINLITQSLDELTNSIKNLTIQDKALAHSIELLAHNASTFHQVTILHNMYTQLINFANILLHLINNIENAITFAKRGILYPSIIQIDQLEHELKLIRDVITKNNHYEQLPYPINPQTLYNYEKIISVSAYQMHSKVNFILNIPLINPKTFTYYHFYALPVPSQINFQMILPHEPLILINENQYLLHKQLCDEVFEGNYLCQLPENPYVGIQPCEVNLLRNEVKNCEPVYITLTEPKIQATKDNVWLAIYPDKTTGILQCEEETRQTTLEGTYIIQLQPSCTFKTNNITLITYKKYLDTNFKLNLLPLPKLENTNISIFQNIKISHINLDNIEKLQNELKQIPDIPIPITPIMTYINNSTSIIIYIFIIIIIIVIIYKYKINKKERLLTPVINIKEEVPLPGTSNKQISDNQTTIKSFDAKILF